MGNQQGGGGGPTPPPPSAMMELKYTPPSTTITTSNTISLLFKNQNTTTTSNSNSNSYLSDSSSSSNNDSSNNNSNNSSNTKSESLQEQEDVVKLEPHIYSGWLSKQTVQRGSTIRVGIANSSAWKRRFFVLKRGCLYYYVEQIEGSFKDNTNKPTVEVESRLPKQLPGTEKVGYLFKLQFDNKLFQLAAFSEDELNEWIHFFENPESGKLKEGWLMVKFTFKGWYGSSDKWSMRYFCMTSTTMEFSKREQHGFYPLAGATVKEETVDEYSFSLDGPTGLLSLKSDTPELRAQWIDCITKEIQRLGDIGETLTDPLELELANRVQEFLDKQKQDTEKRRCNSVKSPFLKDPNTLYILSFDGGGMRGVITTTVLERITQEFPDFLERIDFVAGCSNGGMVATALAFDFDPKFCRALLEIAGNLIFKTGVLANKMNSAKFNNSTLKLLCSKVWGDKKLKDATKKVLVPTFLMDNHAPEENKRSCETRVSHNLTPEEAEEPAIDAIMRTAAAPTFFPSYQQYIDGGMFAHDPSSLALNFAMSPKRLNKRPQDIVLLSLGTGNVNHFYDDPTHNWGLVQWLPKLANCFWDGMLKKSELVCRELLDDRYHRVDPILEKEIPMDDPLQIPRLTEIAKQIDLEETFDWIRKNFYKQ